MRLTAPRSVRGFPPEAIISGLVHSALIEGSSYDHLKSAVKDGFAQIDAGRISPRNNDDIANAVLQSRQNH